MYVTSCEPVGQCASHLCKSIVIDAPCTKENARTTTLTAGLSVQRESTTHGSKTIFFMK